MLVPGLDENMLSVGKMIKHGYFLVFRDDKVAIFEDRKLEHHVATVQLTRNMCFPLIIEDMNPAALKATVEEDAWEWHKKLGHPNFQSLQMLATWQTKKWYMVCLS